MQCASASGDRLEDGPHVNPSRRWLCLRTFERKERYLDYEGLRKLCWPPFVFLKFDFNAIIICKMGPLMRTGRLIALSIDLLRRWQGNCYWNGRGCGCKWKLLNRSRCGYAVSACHGREGVKRHGQQLSEELGGLGFSLVLVFLSFMHWFPTNL